MIRKKTDINGDANSITVLYLVLTESEPQLKMNASGRNVVDGEPVVLTCSLKYRSGRTGRRNAHVMIDHPGSDVIDNVTQKEDDEINSVITVRVKSAKNVEKPTLFGPMTCKVEFLPDDPEIAHNPIRFEADKIVASIIHCK